MKALEAYWPEETSIRDCLKVDAEAADPAVLLAVHQPMKLNRREFGAAVALQTCGEEELLKALLAETGDGRVIVPIVGNAGVGKSHVIRWLDACLQHAPGAERRVVHRISKGQSLKRILGALLERPELAGDRFQKIRQRLVDARDRLSDEQAANLLCEVLAQAVAEASAEAARKFQNGDKDPLVRTQRDLGRVLPTLLREPALRDHHWITRPGTAKGCIGRLVEQFTTSVDAAHEDVRKHQFDPSDLELDVDTIDVRKLSSLAQQTLNVLQLHQPARRADVAEVLNAALDEAKKQVLGLDTSISELFDEVRKELLQSGRELVLLVEDFAVLSGMQKQLLEAIIREGVRDGKQIMCTLRTALAYTEGSASFLLNDTFRSRAKVEWYVPQAGELTGEDSERAAALVGAYLNAARVGVDGLRHALENAWREGRAPGTNSEWIPHPSRPEPESDTARQLDSFGAVAGNALFPLNREAIARLVCDGCKDGPNVVYNPRLILSNVLLKTLERRHEFVHGSFPSKDFRAPRYAGHPEIREKVPSRVPDPAQMERCLTVLAYWYQDAESWLELETRSPLILEAFGLPAPWKSPAVAGNSAGGRPAEPSRPPSPEPEMHAQPLDDELQKWSEGQPLGFKRANKIRKQIAKALDAAIQWDWFCCEPGRDVESVSESILIPRASGGMQNLTPANAVAVPFTALDLDHSIKGTTVLGQMVALERLDSESGWNYDGAELQAARYCALVEGSWARAADFVLRRPVKDVEELVPALVSWLAISARALAVAGADAPDHASCIAALFGTAGAIDSGPVPSEGGSAWTEVERAMARWRGAGGCTEGDNWRTGLLRLVAARQGRGAPLALDVRRLKPAIEEVLRTWNIGNSPDGLEKFVNITPVNAAANASPEFKWRRFDLAKVLNEEVARVAKWLGRVEGALGSIADADSLTSACDEVLKVVGICQAAGLVNKREADEIKADNEKVRASRPMRLLRNAHKLTASIDTGVRLQHRALHAITVEVTLTRWMERCEALFSRIEGQIPEAPACERVDPVAIAREELAKSLDALGAEFSRGDEP